jgi:uncharacterized repeat protein (TIGR01451 family)
MKRQIWRIALLTMVIVLTLVGIPSQSSQAADEVALSVRTVGIIDEDGTILYSVLLGSGEADLSDLVVTCKLPEGTTFVEATVTPEGATFLGEKDGVVSWGLDSLTSETILGPFTFRVEVEAEDTEIPLSPEAEVTWKEPTAGIAQVVHKAGEKLEAKATTGVLSVDAQGTLDEEGNNNPVPVGKTGIKVFIPAGAVKEKTDITFTSIAVKDVELPEDEAESTWWCAVLSVSFEPKNPLTARQDMPIVLSVPTRKTITPGQPALIFVENDEVWQAINELPTTWSMDNDFAKPNFETTSDYAFIDPTGSNVIVVTYNLWTGETPTLIALGTANPPIRTVTTTEVNQTLNIADGTSNTATLLPYIEQDNIIAILIGRH